MEIYFDDVVWMNHVTALKNKLWMFIWGITFDLFQLLEEIKFLLKIEISKTFLFLMFTQIECFRVHEFLSCTNIEALNQILNLIVYVQDPTFVTPILGTTYYVDPQGRKLLNLCQKLVHNRFFFIKLWNPFDYLKNGL